MRVFLFSFASLLLAAHLRAEVRSLTILFTNDVHARLLPDKEGRGGWANIAAYIREVKQHAAEAGAGVLVFDGGDMIQGTAVSSVFQGKPIFEVMNAVGYDAAVLGNHEFDLGSDLIFEYRRIAGFPLLAANITRDGRLVADAPTALFEAGGVRVGIIGICTDEWVYDDRLVYEPDAEAVMRHLPELRRETDLVIALTHLGLERDRKLAESVAGLDFILGAHTHTFMHKAEVVNGIPIVQAGAFGHFVGSLELEVDTEADKVAGYRWNLVPIHDGERSPDPATKEVVDNWEGKVAGEMNVVIGHSARFLDRESDLQPLIGEIWKEAFKTDFGWQNPGANMQDLPAGPIMVRDLYEIMPWGNTLAILDMQREQVRQALGVTDFAENKPTYTVVTNSFEARNLIERFHLPPERVHRLSILARDPVIEYIRKHNGPGNL